MAPGVPLSCLSFSLKLRSVAQLHAASRHTPCAGGRGQVTQLGGQGEGDQVVLDGYLALELALQPLLGLVMLAMRTRAMAARVRHEALGRARFALHLHAWAVGGAAVLQRVQRPTLAG